MRRLPGSRRTCRADSAGTCDYNCARANSLTGPGARNESRPDETRPAKQQQSQAGGGTIDWNDRRNKYIASVEDLYGQVLAFLAEPIAQEIVTAQRHPKQLTENYLGTYSVDDLTLLIGNEQVRFSPSGRNIVGAIGRVDIVGERGEATLILQPGPRWSFVRSRQPTLHVVPFDESSFAEVLQLVMRD